jgi:hypothetical protein
MNKIDEIEPEPELEKQSPNAGIPFHQSNSGTARTQGNTTATGGAADSAKVEDVQ